MTEKAARVLVVDDKETMRLLVAKVLGARYAVALAADGEAALKSLSEHRYDLVLSDVRMPELDGLALVQVVKERWPDTEVVLMTAYASIESAVHAMRLGAYDYVSKPFDPDELGLVVARALEHRRARLRGESRSGGAVAPADRAPGGDLLNLSYRAALGQAREATSRAYLQALLEAHGGNVTRAAQQAGLERESLHRLLKRHGLRANAFRGPGDGLDGPSEAADGSEDDDE